MFWLRVNALDQVGRNDFRPHLLFPHTEYINTMIPMMVMDRSCHQQAKAQRPLRWSGKTRNREPVGAVGLNPERLVQAAA